MGEKNKESTWSTCCVLLTKLVSLIQLVKPPLFYVLRGHDNVVDTKSVSETQNCF